VGRKLGIYVCVGKPGGPRFGFQFSDSLRERARTGARAEHATNETTYRLTVARVCEDRRHLGIDRYYNVNCFVHLDLRNEHTNPV
jgi:hypothetical protein